MKIQTAKYQDATHERFIINGVTTFDKTHRFYEDLQEWVDAGGVIEQEDVIPPETTLSNADFFDRFTKTERKNIRQAAKTDDDVDEWVQRLLMTSTVDVVNAKAQEGIAAMVTAGLLTQVRADEILEPVT